MIDKKNKPQFISANTMISYANKKGIPLSEIPDFRDDYITLNEMIIDRMWLYKKLDSYTRNLYLVKNKYTGLTKIGATNNVKERLKNLQYASGVSLELLYSIEGINAYTLEADLHARFRSFRSIGEWFSLDDFTISELLQCFNDCFKQYTA